MTKHTEVWREVPGYEGAYQVSDEGRVRSLDRVTSNGSPRRGRILKPGRLTGGHLAVALSSASSVQQFRVHQLVMLAFIGERPPGMEIRHLDGVKTNNRLDNLTYGTRSENILDRVRHGEHNNANKTHCKRGHPLSGSNLNVIPRGSRECKSCRNGRAIARERGLGPDMIQQISDEYYARKYGGE